MIRLITITLVLILTGATYTTTAISAIPDTQVLKERPDIATLVLAAALELRNQDLGNPMVSFSPAARNALRTDGFDYSGFNRPRFTLMRCAQSETHPGQIEVGVVMIFTDALLRRTSVSVLLRCTWSTDSRHITVNTATVNHVVPPRLKMVLAIVPAERVPNNLLTKFSHDELLPWIIANRATDSELTSLNVKDYFLFAMVYDQLSTGDELKITVSNDPGGADGGTANYRDLNYDNWHVAMLRGTFNWKANKTFYIKVVHTSPSDNHLPQVIGILSSQLTPVDSDGHALFAGSEDIEKNANNAEETHDGNKVIIPTNRQPVAEFTFMPSHPQPGDDMVFSSTSSDPDGDSLQYTWYIEDEHIKDLDNQSNWEYGLSESGSTPIRLVVEDGRGGMSEVTHTIHVGEGMGEPVVETGLEIPTQATMAVETDNVDLSQYPVFDFTFMPEEPDEGDPIVLVNMCTNPSGEKVTYLWYVDGKHIPEKDNQMNWELVGLSEGPHTIELEARKADGGGGSIGKRIEVY